MPPAGFENAIPTSERLQTYALDLAATEIGVETEVLRGKKKKNMSHCHVFIIKVTWDVLRSIKYLLFERPAADDPEPRHSSLPANV